MGWRQLKTSINVNALNASITRQNRDKIPCNTTASVRLPRNSSGLDWCYMSVNEKFDAPGVLRRSQNLLLAADYVDDADSRVWVTEGPRITANQHYSDSIEVVFEGRSLSDNPQIPFNLTVCSFLQYNGTTAKPRQILFHESWLDFAYSIKDPDDSESVQTTLSSSPFSYPQRPRTTAPEYNLLGMFGNNTRKAGSRLNMMGTYPNTCVAIAWEKALAGVIVLERRLAGPPCIEVVSKEHVDRGRTRPFVASDTKEKYE